METSPPLWAASASGWSSSQLQSASSCSDRSSCVLVCALFERNDSAPSMGGRGFLLLVFTDQMKVLFGLILKVTY